MSFSQTNHIVNAGGFYFNPSDLVINQGDTVKWINDGGLHDVNGEMNSITNEPFNNPETFSSDPMSQAGEIIYTHVFNSVGFYNYDCSVGDHAASGMVGTVIVSEEECEDDDAQIDEWFGDLLVSTCSSLIDYLVVNYNYTENQSCEWNGAPMFDLGGATISDFCNCSCDFENSTMINENTNNIEPVMIIDLLGRVLSKPVFNQPIFLIYENGSVQKISITKLN